GAAAVPVADEERVRVQAEGEDLVAGVEDVVAVGVQRELGHARRRGPDDADAVEAGPGPVADDELVRRQDEGEHGVTRIEGGVARRSGAPRTTPMRLTPFGVGPGGFTMMPDCVPVIVGAAVSLAVRL